MSGKMRIQLNYGSLAGIVSFIIFLGWYIMGQNPLGNMSWLTFWIPLVVVYYGVKKVREEEYEGFMSFGQAYASSTFIVLIYATLIGMLTFLFGTMFDTGLVDMHVDEVYAGLEQVEGMVGEDHPLMEELMLAAEKSIEETTMSTLAMGDVMNKLIGGLIIGLIISGVIKKNKPVFED